MYNEILKDLKDRYITYSGMIEYCVTNMIMNNRIVSELQKEGFEFEDYCGESYDEENDEYVDVFQFFIISGQSASILESYTNELVIYCDKLDLYILCVTHYGTDWDYVRSNWKDEYKGEK